MSNNRLVYTEFSESRGAENEGSSLLAAATATGMIGCGGTNGGGGCGNRCGSGWWGGWGGRIGTGV